MGRNYAYQALSGATLFFEDKEFNRFMGAGALGRAIDEWNGDNFDHAGLGFVGGGYLAATELRLAAHRLAPRARRHAALGLGLEAGGRPLLQPLLRHRSPTAAARATASNYLDLDPTYRDAHGQPLLRHDLRLPRQRAPDGRLPGGRRPHEIARAIGPAQIDVDRLTGPYSIVPYQTTHNTGGAVMGADPGTSVGQQVPAVVGRAEPLRGRRERLPPERGLQPERNGGRLDLSAAPRRSRSRYLKQPGPLV